MQNHQELLEKEKILADEARKRMQGLKREVAPDLINVERITRDLIDEIYDCFTSAGPDHAYDRSCSLVDLSNEIKNTCSPGFVKKDDYITMAERVFTYTAIGQESLLQDAQAMLDSDPAAKSLTEVVLTYPGLKALAMYRLAHFMHSIGITIIPRMITELAHKETGIDIHPAATIGRFCSIDHGTGVVIGETAVIGDNVKLYHRVTLGAKSVNKEDAQKKRHPTIGNNVTIYPGATILGDVEIGDNCIIGGNVMLRQDIMENSLVTVKSPTMKPKNLSQF